MFAYRICLIEVDDIVIAVCIFSLMLREEFYLIDFFYLLLVFYLLTLC
jgi:hypothetical protein